MIIRRKKDIKIAIFGGVYTYLTDLRKAVADDPPKEFDAAEQKEFIACLDEEIERIKGQINFYKR